MSTLSQLAPQADPTRESTPRPPTARRVSVVPYNASDHADAHQFLPWLWQKLKEEGLTELYFPAGGADTGFADFVKVFSGQASVLLALQMEGENAKELIGFVTYTPVQFGHAKSAFGGFVFFREFWDAKTSDAAGRAVLQHWFTVDKLDVVMGATPEPNHLAVRYILRLGFERACVIPGLHAFKGNSCAAVITYFTKERFHTLYGGAT